MGSRNVEMRRKSAHNAYLDSFHHRGAWRVEQLRPGLVMLAFPGVCVPTNTL
ncbi:hypothetical protein P692DRAFT_20128272 [Suillus brevipes Sb2]|nr:hypothetical protein P692DRAFT_20128272 [Suillus brevipes Sb2]